MQTEPNLHFPRSLSTPSHREQEIHLLLDELPVPEESLSDLSSDIILHPSVYFRESQLLPQSISSGRQNFDIFENSLNSTIAHTSNLNLNDDSKIESSFSQPQLSHASKPMKWSRHYINSASGIFPEVSAPSMSIEDDVWESPQGMKKEQSVRRSSYSKNSLSNLPVLDLPTHVEKEVITFSPGNQENWRFYTEEYSKRSVNSSKAVKASFCNESLQNSALLNRNKFPSEISLSFIRESAPMVEEINNLKREVIGIKAAYRTEQLNHEETKKELLRVNEKQSESLDFVSEAKKFNDELNRKNVKIAELMGEINRIKLENASMIDLKAISKKNSRLGTEDSVHAAKINSIEQPQEIADFESALMLKKQYLAVKSELDQLTLKFSVLSEKEVKNAERLTYLNTGKQMAEEECLKKQTEIIFQQKKLESIQSELIDSRKASSKLEEEIKKIILAKDLADKTNESLKKLVEEYKSKSSICQIEQNQELNKLRNSLQSINLRSQFEKEELLQKLRDSDEEILDLKQELAQLKKISEESTRTSKVSVGKIKSEENNRVNPELARNDLSLEKKKLEIIEEYNQKAESYRKEFLVNTERMEKEFYDKVKLIEQGFEKNKGQMNEELQRKERIIGQLNKDKVEALIEKEMAIHEREALEKQNANQQEENIRALEAFKAKEDRMTKEIRNLTEQFELNSTNSISLQAEVQTLQNKIQESNKKEKELTEQFHNKQKLLKSQYEKDLSSKDLEIQSLKSIFEAETLKLKQECKEKINITKQETLRNKRDCEREQKRCKIILNSSVETSRKTLDSEKAEWELKEKKKIKLLQSKHQKELIEKQDLWKAEAELSKTQALSDQSEVFKQKLKQIQEDQRRYFEELSTHTAQEKAQEIELKVRRELQDNHLKTISKIESQYFQEKQKLREDFIIELNKRVEEVRKHTQDLHESERPFSKNPSFKAALNLLICLNLHLLSCITPCIYH